ncbi:MAG: hypothetical protein AUH30_19270 [Candidatus Rokubacteria bacterium 13_1_40CM_68_15]|nr:MAG: hypothetical protein AUH30_19270 [Candidatus Rokubacteria bacterium 13_1_40CM_68_15]
MAERIAVPAGAARAVTLRAGDRLRIVNVAGKQVADFVAFDAGDVDHALSTLHTLVSLKRLFPTKGDQLRTNRRTPMLEITRDDTGRHDMLIAACDPWRYEYDFGVTGHRSCSDNFLEALRAWKLERHQLPQPVNFFQNMSYPDGRVEFGESLARPGDVVEVRALMSVIAAVSACPMDLNPISGYRVSDLVLEIV